MTREATEFELDRTATLAVLSLFVESEADPVARLLLKPRDAEHMADHLRAIAAGIDRDNLLRAIVDLDDRIEEALDAAQPKEEVAS